MGFVITDYLNCEPSEFNFRVLALSGFWPLETKKRWLQILHLLYCYLCSFSLTSMMFIQILDMYLNRNDPFFFVYNLNSSSMTMMSVIKYYLLLYKIDKIKALHKQLEMFKESKTDPEDIEILKMGSKRIQNINKILYTLGILCVIVWMLYPGLDNSKEKRIPFPYRLPIDDWSISPIYEILYTYQAMAMVGFLSIILSNDLILFSFIIRINSQYDILIKDIKNLNKVIRCDVSSYTDWYGDKIIKNAHYNTTKKKKVNDDLKRCLELHKIIIGDINLLQSIYSAPAMIFFTGVAVTVATLGFDIIVRVKIIQLQMIQRLMYISSSLLDCFFWCYYADLMQCKSSEVASAIYGTSWYTMNPNVRKYFLIILLRSHRIPMLKIGNVFSLNLGTYLQMIKIIYNAVTLIYQVVHN